MKRYIVLILSCLSLTVSAGVDEMKQRQPGQPPVEQSDVPGNGNGNGNPNVPIESGLMMILFAAIVVVASMLSIVHQHKNESKKP